jgi:hypothetical protein
MTETTNWFLDKEWINGLQQASMEKLVRMGKGAHHIDVIVRYEGKEYRFEADWIKHLEEIGWRNADIGSAAIAGTLNCASANLDAGDAAKEK